MAPEEKIASRAQLSRDFEALSLRLALLDLQEEETADLMDRPLSPQDQRAMEEALYRLRPPLFRRLGRALGAAHARRLARRTLPRMAASVAALTLSGFLGLTVALAASETLREQAIGFLMTVTPRYTALSLEEHPATFFVPEDWLGHYYPAYVPQGFVFDEVDELFNRVYYFYRDDERLGHFIFSELDADAETNIDTEDSEMRYVSIHGQNALVSVKDGRTFITWAEGNRYFIINTTADTDAALRAADSVVHVK